MTRRVGPTARTRVQEHLADGSRRRHEDRVVGEEPLEVRLAWPGAGARRAWVTMRTPGHDFELATGWVRHEGLVEDRPGAVAGVAYCTDAELSEEQAYNVVTVTLAEPPLRAVPEPSDAVSAGSSACGVCGSDSLHEALSVAARSRWTGALPTPEVVRSLPARLRSGQPVFERTGGAHAAALATADGELLVVREDVGRHNAVDKVTGARVLSGLAPAEACLVVSGRAGFELVAKAVAAGVGSLVSVGAPTSLSVRLATEHGLGLWAFTSAERAVAYAP